MARTSVILNITLPHSGEVGTIEAYGRKFRNKRELVDYIEGRIQSEAELGKDAPSDRERRHHAQREMYWFGQLGKWSVYSAGELSWRSVKKGLRKVKRGYKRRVRPSLRRVARGTGHLVQRGGKWTYRRI